MDEARRFLRFIMPGALFGMLSIAMLILLVPHWTLPKLGALNRDLGIGLAVAGLVGSGALGYALSAIHHQLAWSLPKWSRINHLDLARRLLEGATPAVVANQLGRNGNLAPLAAGALDREMAQALLVSLWYQRLGEEPIKSGDPKVQALADTAHSAGIARVAALAAFATSLGVAAIVGQRSLELEAICRFLGAVMIGVGSTVLFWKTYLRVGRMAERVIENVLLEAIWRAPVRPTTTTIT